MVRFMVLYRTPDDEDAFERHNRDVHIPLAKTLPGLLRYTISHDVKPLGASETYYLVVELDWASMDGLRAAFDSPEGQATAADAAILARMSPDSMRMVFELEEV